MPRLDPLTDEALEIVADNDKLEMLARHVRHALTAALSDSRAPGVGVAQIARRRSVAGSGH
jgi:hypothetical protein